MTLFFTLLPLYLLGNFHCAGMCGPLVMLLSSSPYRWLYFPGRLLSFTLAGLLAAEIGMWLFLSLEKIYLPAIVSIASGGMILLLGGLQLFSLSLPNFLGNPAASLAQKITPLLTQNTPRGVFLFGMGTLLLPCGQTLLVFSACALEGKPLSGLLNGFFFALLTTPSLIASLYATRLFPKKPSLYKYGMGGAFILLGTLLTLRGMAHLSWIPHCTLPPHSSTHIVLF
ncbi:MAG: hypothetical protein K940chlam9_01520 [Chlamydiae bacterium]|nr:hypothetical protein [Chlamydiota bacterium]